MNKEGNESNWKHTEIFNEFEEYYRDMLSEYDTNKDPIVAFHKYENLKSKFDEFLIQNQFLDDFTLEKITDLCIQLNEDLTIQEILYEREIHKDSFVTMKEQKSFPTNSNLDSNKEQSNSIQDEESILKKAREMLDLFKSKYFFHKIKEANEEYKNFCSFKKSYSDNLSLTKVSFVLKFRNWIPLCLPTKMTLLNF